MMDNCPFCKAPPKELEDVEDPDGNLITRCMRCGAFGPDYESGYTWNSREGVKND